MRPLDFSGRNSYRKKHEAELSEVRAEPRIDSKIVYTEGESLPPFKLWKVFVRMPSGRVSVVKRDDARSKTLLSTFETLFKDIVFLDSYINCR